MCSTGSRGIACVYIALVAEVACHCVAGSTGSRGMACVLISGSRSIVYRAIVDVW